MTNSKQAIVTSPLLLSIFTAIIVAVVSYTYTITKPVILEQQRQATLREINHLINKSEYSNNIVNDTTTLAASDKLGQKQSILVYRARKNKQAIAAFFNIVAPDGYNGEITLLIGIYYDETIAGLRVVSHRETPGLGDKIEQRKSNWLDQQFKNKSLQNPSIKNWRVKRDGGVFDQFTGATITPRAVVAAVKKALDYFRANKQQIFQLQTPMK